MNVFTGAGMTGLESQLQMSTSLSWQDVFTVIWVFGLIIFCLWLFDVLTRK